MLNKKNIGMVLFALGASVEIFTPIFSMPDRHIFFKPLIMIGLMMYYWMQSPKPSMLFIAALIFCWLGDVLLIFQADNELFFIGGLVGFLIGHVLYIFCYRQFQFAPNDKELLGSQKARFAFPFILAGTGLVVILYPSLGNLKIPVMIYALAITLMVLNALFRYGRTTKKSFVLIFLGAIMFMISDSLLAINKFKSPFEGAGALIMLTYCVAQLLIVEGAIRHETVKS